jgi:hypothetical protein
MTFKCWMQRFHRPTVRTNVFDAAGVMQAARQASHERVLFVLRNAIGGPGLSMTPSGSKSVTARSPLRSSRAVRPRPRKASVRRRSLRVVRLSRNAGHGPSNPIPTRLSWIGGGVGRVKPGWPQRERRHSNARSAAGAGVSVSIWRILSARAAALKGFRMSSIPGSSRPSCTMTSRPYPVV